MDIYIYIFRLVSIFCCVSSSHLILFFFVPAHSSTQVALVY